ncbi:hypothetical protein FEZ18_12770 [Oceanihabitans sp. IOP_32]|nr:hypothetical protein FEZ18_12770 [Oceanihabitans sp. IOP_32]
MNIYVVFLLVLISGHCKAQTISKDDKLHFGAGALISATTYTIVYSTTKNKKKAFWYSLGASTFVGLAKEVYDSSKANNKFDGGEWGATTLGGLTASISINIFTGKNRNRKKTKMVLID